MAGYRRKARHYKLVFAEEEYNGLQVVMRPLVIEEFLRLASLSSAVTAADKDLDETTELFRLFGRKLVSWNLEDDEGNPVPAGYQGIVAQDLDFILVIVKAWMDAMASVAPPLPQNSSAGRTSALEDSLQLASLSQSLPS